MARVMNVDIISKETIKASSPTLLDQSRSFNLSLFDQLAPSVYVPVVLFYRHFGNDCDGIVKFTERSQCLKRSLSETLTRFFPLAGRIKDTCKIDCNDEGAAYFEAHVDCLLEDILKQPGTNVLKSWVPADSSTTYVGYPLLVQNNLFKCGGIAIGVSITHILSDAATMTAFLKDWSATAMESGEAAVIPPDFTISTIFPPNKDIQFSLRVMQPVSDKCITKIFMFDASKIVALKAKAASASVPNPTRVEAVSALIWKCAMKASRSNSEGGIGLYVISHIMNMRGKIVPPLPHNSFGNFYGIFTAQTEESETNLENLVDKLRKEMMDFNEAVKLKRENGVSMMVESLIKTEHLLKTGGIEVYYFTSWCGSRLYEVDFGWGKPALVGLALAPHKNFMALMDTRDGNGIHAYVCLADEVMALFERDPDLLAFTNPATKL